MAEPRTEPGEALSAVSAPWSVLMDVVITSGYTVK